MRYRTSFVFASIIVFANSKSESSSEPCYLGKLSRVPCLQIPTPAESQANETARIGGINGQRFGVINAILREALTTA